MFTLALWCAAAHADPAGITLGDAMAQADARAAAVLASASQVDAASARVDQAAAGRLPSLGVSGNLSVWSGEQVIDFGAPITVRGLVTDQLAVRVVEPLTGQLPIGAQVDAARSGVAAAESGALAARDDARFQAADVWFVAVQLEKQLEIASGQVASLESRVAAADVAFRAGTLTKNDLLLTQLALGQAKQSVIQLTTARDAARSRLGLAIGNGGEPVMPVEAEALPPRPVPEPAALLARALAARDDLAALHAQAEAATSAARAASLARVPQVNALAVYTHADGQAFAEKNSAFVGVTLDWQVWAWGARTAAMRGAEAQAAGTNVAVNSLEAGIRVEVRSRADALAAATAAWQLAQESVAQAEENLRIQEKRQASGVATMSDLLDAEAALEKAKLNQANALYDARRAEAALTRAVGADPWSG